MEIDQQEFPEILIKASAISTEREQNQKKQIVPLDSQFSLSKNDCSFDYLVTVLYQLYGDNLTGENEIQGKEQNLKTFQIKYRDEDLDLITIASDDDLREALRFAFEKKKKSDNNNSQSHNNCILHLFLVSRQEEKGSEKKAPLELHGIVNLFAKMSMNESNNKNQKNYQSSLLLKGSEWKGYCFYPDSKESYNFKLTILDRSPAEENSNTNSKVMYDSKDIISGVIDWLTPLNAQTKFLGTLTDEKTFKFREYEAIRGADEVELPTNYVSEVDPATNTVKGQVRGSTATFEMEFVGISSKRDGFLSLDYKTANPKRRYDLVTNDSYKGPTAEDRTLAFKKLIYGTPFWYDRTKQGELEPRPADETKKTGYRQSCKNCGMPTFEQLTVTGEKIVACSKYPYCVPRVHSYYGDDYEYYSDY